jgi:hypothetical protein
VRAAARWSGGPSTPGVGALERELRALGALSHPHIVRVLDACGGSDVARWGRSAQAVGGLGRRGAERVRGVVNRRHCQEFVKHSLGPKSGHIKLR